MYYSILDQRRTVERDKKTTDYYFTQDAMDSNTNSYNLGPFSALRVLTRQRYNQHVSRTEVEDSERNNGKIRR